MSRIKLISKITKTKCDSVNHIRFPKEDHLPDWARRDNKVTKGHCVKPVVPASPNSFACKRQFLRLGASWWTMQRDSVGLSQLMCLTRSQLHPNMPVKSLVMAPTVVFYYCRNAFLTDKTNRLVCTFSDAKHLLLQSAIKILPSSPPFRSSDIVLQFLCRTCSLTLYMC